MKLLFDHNLSPRLVMHLADRYPGSQHVFLLGMGEADCSTAEIEGSIRSAREAIEDFEKSSDSGVLTLL
ncbi:DUF5615 family PIN-like protein [cf. Phormidesmis sp. LEGE 11477]|uniref:DUF5615 family PIN-like protein n=1 Tax=cf. Phormidesmis sp. LEGE 11477 TaxID=1828680 RepID=UPI00187F4788|nr:DUF5615 family PIN-like protein [cf. Phormidesmis sp. LEGE 11477]MBE9060587.1 DUF5615 family PIN-like protein [cf. Phormidesmis sp. LEGE 11477]